jgi:hypothetical protein
MGDRGRLRVEIDDENVPVGPDFGLREIGR